MHRLFLLFLTLLLPQEALAASGPWQGDDIFQARLITASDTTGSGKKLTAGLEVKLKDGWKIYWRSPGDAGLPPMLDFSASESVESHHLDFPAPHRFEILGFDSYGYKDQVIFPLTLELETPDESLNAIANFEGLVCADVCIPISERLTISLPSGAITPSAEARAIAQSAAKVPRLSTSSGIRIDSLAIDKDQLRISFTRNGELITPQGGDIFIETDLSGYSFAKPKLYSDHARLKISGNDPIQLKGQPLTVTVVAPNWLLEEQVQIADTLIISTSLLVMLAVAFMGGVILNIMPCVLPVISLKLAQVIGMGGQAEAKIRRSFLATATGVLASFLLLGLTLLLLRQAGLSIGWGIQFQNEYFLVIAALAITLFGVMMLDVIRLPTPQFIGWNRDGLLGDFLAGFMATLLATPCSAPFVGTALTFALLAPSWILLVIFLAMGLGLASPWIVIAARPSLASHLPRPGQWLIVMKRLLALGLFATALWLISIMVTTTSDRLATKGRWQAWSIEAIETSLSKGQVVFVDITATWCLTCKANKALVLDSKDMVTIFESESVALLQADWTKPDPSIAEYLAAHNRFGIPFNIVYGPNAPDGVILPELLTVDRITTAIAEAK